MKIYEDEQLILSIFHADPYRFVSTLTFEEKGISQISLFIELMELEGAIIEKETRPEMSDLTGQIEPVIFYRFKGWRRYDNVC